MAEAAPSPAAGSYWEATAPVEPPQPLTEGLRVDVAIVGGGFTGLSTAYHLSAAGVSCAVVEQHRVGWGASGRNGGQVLPGYDRYLSELVERYGKAAAHALWALAREGLARVERLIREEAIDCGWEAYGHIEAATTPAELERQARLGEALAEVGEPSRLLDRAEMAEAIGAPFYLGGLEIPAARAFHPLRYAQGLARAARRRGARVAEGSGVQTVSRIPGGYRLTLASGVEVRCAELVMATNAYVPPFAPWLASRLLAVTSTLVATEPLPPEVAGSILPGRQTVSDVKMPMYYFRMMDDGRLLFGGGTGLEGASLRRVYPMLQEARVAYTWSGKVAVSPDWLPHLGRTPEGWWFAGGYTGHGAAFSTQAGAMLAAAIQAPDRLEELWGPFAHLPLRRMPLGGHRSFLGRAIRRYLAMREAQALRAHGR